MSALSVALLLLFSLSVTLAVEPKTFTCECSHGTPGCRTSNTCISDEKCVEVSAEYTIDGVKPPSPIIYRTCKNSTDKFPICEEGFISITAGKNYSWISNTTCCTGDKCNQKSIELNEDTSMGKKVCPMCFETGRKSCEPVLSSCTKSQDKCINMIGSYSGDKSDHDGEGWDFALQGCATSTAAFLEKNRFLMLGTVRYTIRTFSIADAHDGATKADAHGATTKADAHGAATKADAHGAATKADAHGAATKADAHDGATKADAHGAATKADAHDGATKADAHGAATKADTHGGASQAQGSIVLAILLPVLLAFLLTKSLY